MERAPTCDPEQLPARWLMLALVAVGTFMSTLDVSIVNVALPTLASAFRTSIAVSQWFVIAYTMVITMLLLAAGKLGDLIGRRRLYVTGVLVFVAGSVVCALSTSALMLILARALQAVGSSMMMSAGPALVTEGFPARERGKALGFIGSSVALGLLAGPLVGGVIVQYAGWRWMFFINVPVGLALAALLVARIRGFDTRRPGRLDIAGAALMAAAVAALIVGLTHGRPWGWTSGPTVSIFAGAVLLGVMFLRIEGRVRQPTLDLALFANREFSIGTFTGWANYVALAPISVFLPFYLQNLLGYDPHHVGLILASGPLTLGLAAPIAGSLSDRIGSRLLTCAGLLIAGAGLVWMRGLSVESSWADVVLRLATTSFGSAIFVSPNSSAVMGSVDCENLGLAGGTVALVRNLGMVCGVALAGAIIASANSSAGAVPAANHAFLNGLRSAFLAGSIVCFVGAAVAAQRTRGRILSPSDGG